MSGSAEEWAQLSEEERGSRATAGTYALLKHALDSQGDQRWMVQFADLLTPTLDSDDPNKGCSYSGYLLKVGEDEHGPWALVSLTSHTIQGVSIERRVEGFEDYYKSMYSDPSNILDGITEIRAISEKYPEIDEHVDLALPVGPLKFYIADMPACLVWPKSNTV